MGCSNTKPLAAASAPDTSPAPNPSATANALEPPKVVVEGEKIATDAAVNGDSGEVSSEIKAAAPPNPFGDVKSVHLEEPSSESGISHTVEPVVEDPIAEEAEAAADAAEEVPKVEAEVEIEVENAEGEETLEATVAICPTDTSEELPETEAEVEEPTNTEEGAEETPPGDEETPPADEETAVEEEEEKEAEEESPQQEQEEDNKENEPSEV